AQETPILAPKTPPSINVSGDWILQIDNDVWRATLRQSGAKLQGTLIPVSGDSGTLTGFVDGNNIYLSRFDGIRATLVKATLNGNTLEGSYNSRAKLTGHRADEAPVAPPDPSTYTRMKNPDEPIQFSFRDLNGRMVSAEDFRGKPLLVTITGS